MNNKISFLKFYLRANLPIFYSVIGTAIIIHFNNWFTWIIGLFLIFTSLEINLILITKIFFRKNPIYVIKVLGKPDD